MQKLTETINRMPVVPYIRQCDFAVRKPWVMPERRLLDYLLIYVQEGDCCFEVDDKAYRMGKGDICFIQPNSLNRLEGLTNTVTPFAHFDIFYHAQREESFPTRAGQTNLSAYSHLLQPRLDELAEAKIPVKLKLDNEIKFRNTFLKVVEWWQHPDPVMQLKAQTGLSEIVVMIMEQYAPGVPASKSAPAALSWVTSYLSFHLSDPVGVADMAKRANMSVSRFNELFKMQYGMTPHQFLLDMRVNHACELLRESALSQEKIAAYCGFSDIHHFSKAFRGRMGMAPGEYRKQQ
ncbi:AraC family transcriptional regulator [Paenibacillus sp. LHD-117]|uniref:AraC family transcriptional regulator n=1 Tax=Paenibacillus sp. LHD-117 TaxID=3071412 RepID=UPI0027E14A74|nr:AraC family transcriptional regulator [Paenibacillus sp. LHD-117]MDQ6423367.1 AraC family transcriptional regulator [Paenibacillus sp. LHD-117]